MFAERYYSRKILFRLVISLVEIIQFEYKSDVRFVSDLRKIGSRISDWKLDPNGSQSEPIGKNYQNTIGTNYHSMRETKFDISESILYTNFGINFIVILFI